jgi:Beta-propeller repeat
MRTLRFFLAACLTPLCASAEPGLIFSRTLPVITQANLNSGLIRAAVVDSSENTYLTGSTQSAAFPVTTGAIQPVFGGGTCTDPTTNPQLPPFQHPCDDAFVVKLDPRGNIVFATYLGGSGPDQGQSIAVDSAGYIYVGGATAPGNLAPNDFPVTPGGAFGSAAVGGGFVAKLDPFGRILVYSKVIPESGGKTSVAVDQQGNAYFATTGTAFPATSGALQTGSVAVGKLNPTGSTLAYGARFGVPQGNDSPSAIAVDAMGNAYITGISESTGFPVTPGAFQASNKSGQFTAFVAKLNASGSALVYATYLGGKVFDSGNQIRVDAQGDAYVLGFTQSPDFPVTSGAPPSGSSAPPDSGFLTKLSPDGGQLIYSTFISSVLGAAVLNTSNLDVDAEGNVYLAGVAARGVRVSPGAVQSCFGGGGQDVFAARLDPAGKLDEAT